LQAICPIARTGTACGCTLKLGAGTSTDPDSGGGEVEEPLDLERARLLLVWLQARRRVDATLSELLAAGPAGERRVRGRLQSVEDLERAAQQAFATYCASARSTESDASRPRAGHSSQPGGSVSPIRPLRLIGNV
jgi:hypothetical protein